MTGLALLAFVASTFPDQLHFPKYPCELIKSEQSCNFMPGCSYNFDKTRCNGLIDEIPRFISEFRNESNNAFSIETILAAQDLQAVAKHHKTLAEHIKQNKSKDPRILDEASIGVFEKFPVEQQLEAAMQKYGIAPDAIVDYPSATFLISVGVEAVEKLAKEIGFTVPELLKINHQALRPFLFEPDEAAKKLKLLGTTAKEAISKKQLAFLWAPDSSIKMLLNDAKLSSAQILSIGTNQTQLFYNPYRVVYCVNKGHVTFDWLLKLSDHKIYVALDYCDKVKKIADAFKIGIDALPVSVLKSVINSDVSQLSSLHNELGLKLDFFLGNLYIPQSKVAAVKALMSKWSLSAEQAMLVDTSWNDKAKELPLKHAADFKLPLEAILKIPAQYFHDAKLLSTYQKLQLPLADIVNANLIGFANLDGLKELLDLQKAQSKQELDRALLFQLREIAQDASKIAKLKKDWQDLKRFVHFSDFVRSYVAEGVERVKSKVILNRITIGNLERVKRIPFVKDFALLFDPVVGPVFVYANQLGYQDMGAWLKQLTPKTVRVTESTDQWGKKTYELPIGKDAFVSTKDAWYLEKIEHEPTKFVHFKEVGQLIATQAGFWSTTDIKSIAISGSNTVEGALESYKGAGYTQMSQFTGSAKDKPFPYSGNTLISKQINSGNFAILLAPKGHVATTVYRGQGCDKKWIINPQRFWSTSASALFARNWAHGQCVLEVRIPQGFPLFFLNIASMVNAGEHEFLLPSHALNKKGKLVPMKYEVVSEVPEGPFLASEYDSEHDVEYQFQFNAHSYVVKPAADFMIFEGGDDAAFKAYEKRYAELLCSKDVLGAKQNNFAYLKQMCKSAKTWQR